MSEIVIKKFENHFRQQVEEIFFESSTKKSFLDTQEKATFRWKYLDYYLKTYPQLSLVALQGEKVMGYVVAALKTGDDVFLTQPHLEIFKDNFAMYPAHLHMNCHHDSRGQGVGTKLLLGLESKLESLGIKGLHIMTGPDSQNRAFYTKLGFNWQLERAFQGRNILMMGKKLTGIVRDP